MTEYYFWTLHVDRGRTYAARHSFRDPHGARAEHARATDFQWAPPVRDAAIVGALYAHSGGRHEVAIAPEVRAAQQELT